MSANVFECNLCPSCVNQKESSEVVQLKCHTFCWTCLNNYLKEHLSSKIKCPVISCDKNVPDNVIRKTLSEECILKYESICLENLRQSHRCLLPECNSIIFYTDTNIQYECRSCSMYNCILCNAAHAFYTCAQYNGASTRNKSRVCNEEINRAKEHLKVINRDRQRESLLNEDKEDILTNDFPFSCWMCCGSIAKEMGVKLRDCSHAFCRPCISEHIATCNTIPALCPMGCKASISDREIQSLLSGDQMVIYQNKYNMVMKRKISNHFQCKYPNCDALYTYTESPGKFLCVKCNHENCVECSAVHGEESCQKYRDRVALSLDSIHIEESIRNGDVMKCPDCNHLLHKTMGCNWIRCDRCLVELCWIRQMHRWGPKGSGDISGGCKCGVNKQFCHPNCRGCIPDHR